MIGRYQQIRVQISVAPPTKPFFRREFCIQRNCEATLHRLIRGVFVSEKIDLKLVDVEIPEGWNIVVGQSHFIKTVEDIHEAVSEAVPGARFGLAFCEASGPCLVRKSGTDNELVEKAVETAKKIGAGHSFVLYMKNMFPVNVLNRIKNVSEVCRIFCATANPLQVIVAESEQGRGIMGVIDGFSPKGTETEEDAEKRKQLLRAIGYKVK